MSGQRKALIVANDRYEQEGLQDLLAPAADAEALGRVLGDPQIGDFAVQVVRNEPAHVISAQIEEVFSEGRPDDVLLLHFSGHGLKSESGELFFAASNTRPNRLGSTAVSADFVQRCMRASRSRSVVLLLDCCYGGAFAQGVTVRAAGDVNVLDSFPQGRAGGGRGRAVITASNAMEFAFEGDQLGDNQHRRPSVFTSALVEGLATGEADRDEDGWVSLDDLYDYVFDKVREQNPHQTPSRQVELEGELYVARSRRRRIRPAPLPPDLQEALAHPNMYTRLGAISELRARLASDNLPAAAGAYEALAELTRTDIRYIADPAAAALQEAALHPEETQLDFGQIEQGSASPHRTVRLLGPPIARACVPHPSDAWIRVTETAGGFDVSVDTSRTGTLHGTLDLKGPTGEATITIYADLVSPLPQASHIPNSGKPEVSSPPHGSPAAESGRPASPGVMAPPSDARIRQRGRASPQGVQSASVLAERYQQALRHMEAGEWQEALTQLTAIQGADSGYKDTGQLAVRARRELAGSSTGDAQPIPLRPKSLKEIRLPKRVNAVVFSPDSTCLAIASGQMAVMVDLTGKEQLRVRHPGLVASIQDVAFDSTGHWLATAGHNEALIWDVATGKRALQVTHQSVRGVSFNPVSAAFATWGADRVVRIWDATTSSKLGSAVADRAINGMVFSRDGRRFATGAGRYAQIWDTATGRQGLQLSHPGRVERVAFSPDGRWLATTARDGGARVWDAATGDQRLRIAADEQMNRVTFSPDGRWLATAGGLGAASIFHTATGDRLSRIPPSIQGYEYDTMHEVVFSPDGTFIAISVNEGRIDLWQVTGEQ